MVKVAANAKIAPHPYLLHNAGNCAARSRGQLRVVHEYLRTATRALVTADRLSARLCLHSWDDMVDWLDGTFVAHTHLSDLISIAVGCRG